MIGVTHTCRSTPWVRVWLFLCCIIAHCQSVLLSTRTWTCSVLQHDKVVGLEDDSNKSKVCQIPRHLYFNLCQGWSLYSLISARDESANQKKTPRCLNQIQSRRFSWQTGCSSIRTTVQPSSPLMATIQECRWSWSHGDHTRLIGHLRVQPFYTDKELSGCHLLRTSVYSICLVGHCLKMPLQIHFCHVCTGSVLLENLLRFKNCSLTSAFCLLVSDNMSEVYVLLEFNGVIPFKFYCRLLYNNSWASWKTAIFSPF